MRDLNDLNRHEKQALNDAIGAIYFNDSHDYRTALWDVVHALLDVKPSEEDKLDETELFNKLNPEL